MWSVVRVITCVAFLAFVAGCANYKGVRIEAETVNVTVKVCVAPVISLNTP